jgi:glycosyltransferase involved in cell wall biosynthesis
MTNLMEASRVCPSAPKPLVSVVTPFYNTAEYLAECIESVLSQTYGHYEYLLVNNRSDDGSLAIAEHYARLDSRIRVYSNPKFLTQVQNYNAAVELISPHSCYTKIVQADDRIFPRCLGEMVAVAESDESVGIVSSFCLRGSKVGMDGFPFSESVVCGRQLCRYQLLEGDRFFRSPTTVMYRSAVVRDRAPFYKEGRYFEDTEACFEVLQTWNFGFVQQVLSFQRDDNESIMSRVKTVDPRWWLLDRFIITRQYGRMFLAEEQFQRRWSVVEREYLNHLASRLWSARSRSFWDYHLRGLESVGYKLSPKRMRLLAAGHLFASATNPKKLASRIRRALFAVKRTMTSSFGRGAGPLEEPHLAVGRVSTQPR